MQAIDLASTLLAQSVSFLHELCNYIALTLAGLKCSVFCFSTENLWYLMSKLIF